MLTLPSTFGNDCRHHCQHVWGNQKKSIVAGNFKGLSVVPVSKILGCQLGLVQRRTHTLSSAFVQLWELGWLQTITNLGLGLSQTLKHSATFWLSKKSRRIVISPMKATKKPRTPAGPGRPTAMRNRSRSSPSTTNHQSPQQNDGGNGWSLLSGGVGKGLVSLLPWR